MGKGVLVPPLRQSHNLNLVNPAGEKIELLHLFFS